MTKTSNANSAISTSARYIAWNVLMELENSRFFLHADEKVHEKCDKAGVEPRDRRLVCTLVLGAVSNRVLLEHYITRYASRPLKSIDPGLRWLLVTALYQLILLDRITDYAVVNEAVTISKYIRKPAWAGFINGILRAYLRDAPKRPRTLPDNLPSAIRYSHPAWLVKRWNTSFGEEETEKILAWNNRQPEQYARARNGSEAVAGELGEELVHPAPEFGTDALRILKTSEVIKSRTFEEGKLYLMQPWSMMVARQLPLENGWQVLDMCAAPGGKSIALADRADIHITAADISEARIPRMKENFVRCRVADKITVLVLDGRNSEKAFGSDFFDAVLIDAPCSNLGVIQRNPEVRWRIRPENITELSALQRELLASAVRVVKPGGYVLYAVCTITPEETEQAVNTVLREIPGLECIGSSRNLPGEGTIDGGFRALIRKT
jgi:16S rRNA (cytosine967-C5)-methyltransferase